MNLHRMLVERQIMGKPLRVGMIGAGKFGSMYLAQARRTPGIHLVGLADLSVSRALDAFKTTGWAAERYSAKSLDEAARTGGTHVCDDADALISCSAIEIIVEVTGNPLAAVRHAVRAFAAKKHVINVRSKRMRSAGRSFRERLPRRAWSTASPMVTSRH